MKTLPIKPWTIKYDGSANTIRDASGNIVALVPDASVAEHIQLCCNDTQKEIERIEKEIETACDDATNIILDNIEENIDCIISDIESGSIFTLELAKEAILNLKAEVADKHV